MAARAVARACGRAERHLPQAPVEEGWLLVKLALDAGRGEQWGRHRGTWQAPGAAARLWAGRAARWREPGGRGVARSPEAAVGV